MDSPPYVVTVGGVGVRVGMGPALGVGFAVAVALNGEGLGATTGEPPLHPVSPMSSATASPSPR
jgi:hypothetical protein